MKIAIVILSIWAVAGPIWAILFARKNPTISGWIARRAALVAAESTARAAQLAREVEDLKAKLAASNANKN